MYIRTIYVACFIFAGLACKASAADLEVNIMGLRSANGNVHMAVYANPKTFPDYDGMLSDIIMPAKTEGIKAIFRDLAPGSYALATYHDENNNNEFDQIIFGIPVEGFAFSRNAKVVFAPPDFKDAAITLGKKGTSITINMDYWISARYEE